MAFLALCEPKNKRFKIRILSLFVIFDDVMCNTCIFEPSIISINLVLLYQHASLRIQKLHDNSSYKLKPTDFATSFSITYQLMYKAMNVDDIVWYILKRQIIYSMISQYKSISKRRRRFAQQDIGLWLITGLRNEFTNYSIIYQAFFYS